MNQTVDSDAQRACADAGTRLRQQLDAIELWRRAIEKMQTRQLREAPPRFRVIEGGKK